MPILQHWMKAWDREAVQAAEDEGRLDLMVEEGCAVVAEYPGPAASAVEEASSGRLDPEHTVLQEQSRSPQKEWFSTRRGPFISTHWKFTIQAPSALIERMGP